jgi:thioester reductase-like protein
MPTTLVTGGNGFVGASVVSTLLSSKYNHRVILAVRSVPSAEALLAIHPEWPAENVVISSVPDFTVPGAFDEVFKTHPEIDYVIHVAAPLLDDPRNNDFVEHFEKPNVLGNIGILTSAKQFGKNVKAISVTGSVNAITLGDQDDVKKRVFGNKEWLAQGREDAIKAQHNYVSIICLALFCFRTTTDSRRRRSHIVSARKWQSRHCGSSSRRRSRPSQSRISCLP